MNVRAIEVDGALVRWADTTEAERQAWRVQQTSRTAAEDDPQEVES